MSDRDVNITIRGRNLSDPAFNDAKKNLTSLGAEARQAKSWGDLIAAGMGHAGKEASASGKLIAGMGQSGREAMAKVHAESELLNRSLAGGSNAFTKWSGSLIPSITVGSLAADAITGIARSLGSMAAAAFDNAGKLVDLSGKTGLSTDSIQRMQYVADQTGGSLEQFTDSAFQLGVRLSGGSESVQGAVAKLGLSFTELQQKRPDEQFEIITGALGRMQSETERNDVGVQLFGKSFANIAAAVSQGYGEMANAATVSSAAQLQALDAAGDAWADFVTNAKASLTSLLGESVLRVQALKDVLAERGIWTSTLGALAEAQSRVEIGLVNARTEDIKLTAQSTTVNQTYTEQLAAARQEVASLTSEKRQEILAAKQLGVDTDVLTAKFGLSEAALAMVTEQQKRATQETSKAAQEKKRAAEAEAEFVAKATLASNELAWMLAKLQPMPAALDAMNASTMLLASSSQSLAMALQQVNSGAAIDWNPISQGISQTVAAAEQAKGAFASLFDGMKGGFQSLIDGMTGKNGLSGLFSNLGDSIINGFGNLLSGGLTSAINMGISLAAKGIGKLASMVGDLFKSEESREVNKPRDRFFESFGGLEGLTNALMGVQGMAAETADALIRAVYGAKTKDAFDRAVAAIREVLKGVEDVGVASAKTSTSTVLSFDDVDAKVQDLIAAIGTSDRGLAAEVTGLGARIRDAAARGVTDFSVFGGEVDRLRGRFEQSAHAGVVGFQSVWQAVQQLDASVSEENHGLSRDIEDLQARIEAAAQAGVTNFAEFADEIDALKERMRESVEFTIRPIIAADPGNDALYAPYGGRQNLRNRIHDWLLANKNTSPDASNPYDWNRADRALGIPMHILMGAWGAGWGGTTLHDGGMIRRAHSGMYLAPDEVPIIAQTGEGVLSRRGMAALGGEAALNRLNAGQAVTNNTTCTVIVIDEGGQARRGGLADVPERLRAVVQDLLDGGALRVPQRAIAARAR